MPSKGPLTTSRLFLHHNQETVLANKWREARDTASYSARHKAGSQSKELSSPIVSTTKVEKPKDRLGRIRNQAQLTLRNE